MKGGVEFGIQSVMQLKYFESSLNPVVTIIQLSKFCLTP